MLISEITKNIVNSYTYSAYRKLVQNLLEQKKSTGALQTEDLFNFSVLNDKRMSRLDKTIELQQETIQKLKELQQNQKWILISEGWCGDAAQNVPIIAKMASVTDKINLQIVLRDENLELMDCFLTNGGRAIPKLIMLDENENVMNTWGPRPSLATQMVAEYKEKHGKVDAELKKNLQVWYNKNKGVNLQEDILTLV